MLDELFDGNDQDQRRPQRPAGEQPKGLRGLLRRLTDAVSEHEVDGADGRSRSRRSNRDEPNRFDFDFD